MTSSFLPPGLSVVVPVFNSAAMLPVLLERLIPVLANLMCDCEVVLVNDGSLDDSWRVIEELQKKHDCVRGLDLIRNFGQHNALLCGVRAARFETTVTLDDDLQNPPEEIPTLLARLNEGYDVVYGAPRQEQHGLRRDIASIVTKWVLQSVISSSVARRASSFRAFRTSLRDAFASYNAIHPSMLFFLFRAPDAARCHLSFAFWRHVSVYADWKAGQTCLTPETARRWWDRWSNDNPVEAGRRQPRSLRARGINYIVTPRADAQNAGERVYSNATFAVYRVAD
ncbi:MAG TPA: glycosyltransferase family 2 protein [Abditibacteriaceae bacterium]|jgi:glycosyltransferase involved in cell wall biosynthesis